MATPTETMRQAVIALAESCGTLPPKGLLGNPAAAPEPSGDPKTPDKVTTGGGHLVFDVNSLLGTSDASGSMVRVKLISSGLYEDLAATWDPGTEAPPGQNWEGKNQITTVGLLGQTAPGSSTAADYEVDTLVGHGSAWELDSGNKPKVANRVEVEGIGGYLEGTVITKLNELIAQYNQLRTDYNNATRPTTATAVTGIPMT